MVSVLERDVCRGRREPCPPEGDLDLGRRPPEVPRRTRPRGIRSPGPGPASPRHRASSTRARCRAGHRGPGAGGTARRERGSRARRAGVDTAEAARACTNSRRVVIGGRWGPGYLQAMDVTFTELPALRLVGYRCFGRLGELPDRVHPAWRGLAKEAPGVAGLLEPGIFYGVMPDADHLRPPPDGVYIYWTCVRIASDAPFPKGMGQLLVPAASLRRRPRQRGRGADPRVLPGARAVARAEWRGSSTRWVGAGAVRRTAASR